MYFIIVTTSILFLCFFCTLYILYDFYLIFLKFRSNKREIIDLNKIRKFNLYVNSNVKIGFNERYIFFISFLFALLFWTTWTLFEWYLLVIGLGYTCLLILQRRQEFAVQELAVVKCEDKENKKMINKWLKYNAIVGSVVVICLFFLIILETNCIVDETFLGFPIKQTLRYFSGDIGNIEYNYSIVNQFKYKMQIDSIDKFIDKLLSDVSSGKITSEEFDLEAQKVRENWENIWSNKK